MEPTATRKSQRRRPKGCDVASWSSRVWLFRVNNFYLHRIQGGALELTSQCA